MTRRLVFTVDVDRDVNFQVEGSDAAGSLDFGSGTAPRFTSSERGLSVLLDILDDIGMRATFFVEGRTAETIDCSGISSHCVGFHGYDHEDLTKVSDPGKVMDRGYAAVRDSICRPVCFRAPYMTIDDGIYGHLSRLGIGHDSSAYGEPGAPTYQVSGVTVHPVAKGKDANGKTIAAYLWPMHEGRRIPSDYLYLARSMTDGELVLSTHSWHMVESRESGPMSEELIRANSEDLRTVLCSILDEGFEPSVLTDVRP